MSDVDAYDQQVQALRTANQPLLEAFQAWPEQAGLSRKTVAGHRGNSALFATFLLSYEPLKTLDAADSGDVSMFLGYWFPRKALWASTGRMAALMAALKKFFHWLGMTGRVSADTVEAVVTILKEDRAAFLAAVAE